ncbi:uncharacterized protein LOC144160151 [Haemaphysalis longicornis]
MGPTTATTLEATAQPLELPSSAAVAVGSSSNGSIAFLTSTGETGSPTSEPNSPRTMVRQDGPFYDTFVKNQLTHSIPYITLVAASLVVVAVCFVIYARRHVIWNEQRGAANDRSGSLILVSKKLGTLLGSKRASCRGPSCYEQVKNIVRSLDAGVGPCRNFYDHVCASSEVNGTADEQLAQLTATHVLAFLKAVDNPDLPVVAAARRLWRDCVDEATISWLGKEPLVALLNVTGLGGWPYDQTEMKLPDVWETANRLQRLMDIAPLSEESVLPYNGQVKHEHKSSLVEDVLDAMLALRSNDSQLHHLAAAVADLESRLSDMRNQQRLESSRGRTGAASSSSTHLMGDAKPVRAEVAAFIEPRVRFVNASSPRVVLNLLGYRLVRHVRVFTPAAVRAHLDTRAVKRRESQCARVVLADALTDDAAEYVRYAALRNQLDFEAMRSVAALVKSSLEDKLARLRWMDHVTRETALLHLREIEVRFSFDRYEGSNERGQAPEVLPSHALATYQRFREARFRSRVLGGATDSALRDRDCAYDSSNKVRTCSR